jgi:hypothetical protein
MGCSFDRPRAVGGDSRKFRHMDDRETLAIVLPIYQQIVLGIS